MFFEQIENKKTKNDRRMKELEIEFESLSRQLDGMYEELGISPEELESFLSNADNFTAETWKALLAVRDDLDQKLNSQKQENGEVQHGHQGRSHNDRFIAPHWIHVR